MKKRECIKKIMQFLMGLNEEHNMLRKQILLRDPLPTLDEVFNMVSEDESNQDLQEDKPSPYTSAMVGKEEGVVKSNAVRQSPSTNARRSGAICTHCGKPNHIVEKCFELHGYPPGHPRNTSSNGVQCKKWGKTIHATEK